MGEVTKPGRWHERPQMRQQSVREWTQTKRNIFLAELAQTANVTASAAAVSMSDTGAYKLRKRDPGFARAWDEALHEGYAKLELLLLQRALAGAGGDIVEPGDGSKAARMSERTQMALLNHHRAAVRDYRVNAAAAEGRDLIAEEKAAREALRAKLEEMRVRLTDHDDS